MALNKEENVVKECKDLRLRVPNKVYEMILKDVGENESINQVVYEILANHYLEIPEDLSFARMDIFAEQIAKEVNKDFSICNNQDLLIESYLQILRSKILKKVNTSIGGLNTNE